MGELPILIGLFESIPSLLNYGLLGLAALILFLFWRVVSAEQARDGQPRKGIIKLCYLFIGLSVLLAGAAMVIELTGAPHVKLQSKELKQTNQELEESNQELAQKVARLEERENSQAGLIDRLDIQIAQLSEMFLRLKASFLTPRGLAVTGTPIRMTPTPTGATAGAPTPMGASAGTPIAAPTGLNRTRAIEALEEIQRSIESVSALREKMDLEINNR